MIIGIIGEEYLSFSILLLFFVAFVLVYYMFPKKKFGYLYTLIKPSFIFTLIACTFISYAYSYYRKMDFQLLREGEIPNTICTIKSDAEEKKYTYCYVANIENVQGHKHILCNIYIKKGKNSEIFIAGDIILIKGVISIPSDARNEGGFNQRKYYMRKGIYANIIVSDSVRKIGEKWNIEKIGSIIRNNVKNRLSKSFDEEKLGLFMAITMGMKDGLNETQVEHYRNGSLIHILCVSGAHITLLITGINKLALKAGRKAKNCLILIVLVCFNIITGFSPSVVRASIMGRICNTK